MAAPCWLQGHDDSECVVGHAEVIGLKGYLLREKTLQVRPAERIAVQEFGTLGDQILMT
jgi:hypothetical protein